MESLVKDDGVARHGALDAASASKRKSREYGGEVTARAKYDLMIRDELGPWLRERGFKKRRNSFRRSDDAGWQVIDFQASQWGSRDDVRFTINLWVGVTELADAEAGAQVQQRIGALLPGGEDYWWSLATTTDAAELADELRHVLADRAMPWLESRRSLDQLMTLARNSPDEFPAHLLGRFKILLERAGLDALASEVPA